MTAEWWFQDDDETLVWDGRPRWSAAIGGITAGVVLVAVAVAAAVLVDPRLATGGLLGVGIAVWQVLRVRHTSYRVTSRAIWHKQGVVGRTVRRVGLPQVQNTAYSQSVTGSMFGYGTVTVEIAGGRDLKLRRIDDPETVRRTITDLIEDTDTDRELPGSPEQWRDVLSVIRDLTTAID